MTVYDNASELNNVYLEIYFDEYKALSDAQKRNLGNKYKPIKLFLETNNYNVWFENEESADTTKKSDKKESVNLSDMSPLEGDEKVKEGKGLKILTPNKLLTRLPALLAQIKVGNNSYKLKMKYRIMQISYLFCQHNKITKKV